jgi:hypothetical protein
MLSTKTMPQENLNHNGINKTETLNHAGLKYNNPEQ